MNVGIQATKNGELRHVKTLAGLVKDYRKRFDYSDGVGGERSKGRHDPVVDFAAEAKNLEECINRATSGRRRDGKMFSEDSCIKQSARVAFTKRLVAKKAKLAKAVTFDHLYNMVREEKILRIGDLMIYNVAARIGAYLNLHPAGYLYIHAGPRKGWKRLMGERANRFRVPIDEVPQVLRDSLEVHQIEDFLCEYSEFVHRGLVK